MHKCLYTCIYSHKTPSDTHMYAYRPTYTYTRRFFKHTYTHMYAFINTHQNPQTHTLICIYVYIDTHRHSDTYINPDMRTQNSWPSSASITCSWCVACRPDGGGVWSLEKLLSHLTKGTEILASICTHFNTRCLHKQSHGLVYNSFITI